MIKEKKKIHVLRPAFAYGWQNLIFTWTLSMIVLADMKMTATCLLLPDVFGDDPSLFVIVNKKV